MTVFPLTCTEKQMGDLERQHGSRWERYIRRECHELREARLAVVRKNWRAPEVPASGTKARIEASKPDFDGTTEDGQYVVFEAKATLSETSFPFSNVAGHQADHLADAWSLGAAAFLYLLDGELRKWVVPWGVVQDVAEERSSYPFGAYPDHRKRDGETFIDTLERLEVL